MDESLNAIQAACACLEDGRYKQAIALVDRADRDGPVCDAIRSTALGLIAEQAGEVAEADSHLDQAFAIGVPLPTLLSRQGDYFKRHGELARAYACYSILERFRPTVQLFREGIPDEELARYAPWLVSRLLTRPRPQHWFYPPIKSALVAQLGVEAAALAFAEMAGNKLGELRTLELTSLRQYARARSGTYEELVPGREVRVPPLPVFGESSPEGFVTLTRSLFLAVLDDVIVSSKSNLLFTEKSALLDYQDDELDRIELEFRWDPTVFGRNGQDLTVMIEANATTEEPLKRAFSLVGLNSYNFGHWLIEFLPKVWACSDRPGFESLPILIDEQMHPQLRPALEFFVGPEHPIVVLKRGEAVRVEELWACSSITYFPFSGGRGRRDLQTIDGDAFAGLICGLETQLASVGARADCKRVYLARADTQHRRLVNRSDVEAWFEGNGFEILDLGTMSFVEQLRTIRGADLVVGPDGSALWLTFLGRPGTRVGYLNNPYLENHWFIAEACRSLALHLSILTGEVVREHADPTKSDYRIDVAALPAFVDELVSR